MTAEDERAIAAMLVRYATGIDRRDWTLFRTCFTDDCVADYPGFGLWHGGEAITAAMEKAHAGLGPTLHRMSNFIISGDGDTAEAGSYVDALLMPAEPGGAEHRGEGRYEDLLVRTTDGWRIRARRFVAVRIG